MNITKMTKRSILKYLTVRFLKDYSTDILCVLVFSELAFIVVKSL